MRFKEFLLTEAPRQDRPQPTPQSVDQFIEWCEENCSKFLKKNHVIYRGMERDVNVGIIDTNQFNRKSANTRNFYTLWMDNHPSWKGYPKRSKAYIASSDEDGYAGGFGQLFLLFPEDTALIGVCSHTDLWYSFSHYMSANVSGGTRDHDQMGDEMFMMYNLFKYMASVDTNLESKLDAVGTDFNVLVEFLKEATPEVVRNFADSSDWDATNARSRYKAMVDRKIPNMYKLWVDAMDPKKNGFKYSKASAFGGSGGNEIWVQGQVGVLLYTAIAENTKLRAFIKKHYPSVKV